MHRLLLKIVKKYALLDCIPQLINCVHQNREYILLQQATLTFFLLAITVVGVYLTSAIFFFFSI